MRLTELEPRWIHPNVFVFLCPHCRQWLLSVKNVQMSEKDQSALFEREFGEDWNTVVVLTRPGATWSISVSIDNLTVTPSVDASASGCWHGFITNGEIQA